jgi:hypothetical protein
MDEKMQKILDWIKQNWQILVAIIGLPILIVILYYLVRMTKAKEKVEKHE